MSRRARTARRGAPRVLIIVQNLPVPLDRRVWMECRALRRAGYRVSVICPKAPGDPRYEELDGVRIRKYAPPPTARGVAGYFTEFVYCWLVTAYLTVRTLFAEGFDVIQACNPPDTYFALAAPLKLARKRFVFDEHDQSPDVYAARFDRPNPVLLRALRVLQGASHRTADHVIVTNEFEREIVMSKSGFAGGEVTVVRNAPEASRFQRTEPDAALRRGRRFLCAYLGVMGPQDGVDIAIRAAHVLVHEMGRDDVQFAFLGFGDAFDELRSLTTELGLDDHVHFTGRADDDVITSYLSTADVGLVPDPKSTFNDTSSMNKTVEYMAFALPFVAFELRETMATGDESGLYVADEQPRAFARAIATLLDDPGRRVSMGRAGRVRFESALSWEHQAPRYVAVYDALTGGPPPAPGGTTQPAL